MLSRQGVNIAFIGLNRRAQTACAEYLVRRLEFKRMEFDEPVNKFLRTIYDYKHRDKIDLKTVRAFYHETHKLDPDVLANHFKTRFEMSEGDVVVSNVEYVNEMMLLKELGFTIVRVTSEVTNAPRLTDYVKGSDKGTVALAMLYDRSFSADYSLHYTTIARREQIIEPLLADLGYKVDKDT